MTCDVDRVEGNAASQGSAHKSDDDALLAKLARCCAYVEEEVDGRHDAIAALLVDERLDGETVMLSANETVRRVQSVYISSGKPLETFARREAFTVRRP